MSTVVQCPSCKARIKVPDDRLGQWIKCPRCEARFATEDPSEFAEIIEVREPDRTPPMPGFYVAYILCGLAFVVGLCKVG